MPQHNGFSDAGDISRIQSPRPETPEPYVRQGRRNAPVSVQLLDDEGAISEKFERCLGHIFAKYCTPTPEHTSPSPQKEYGSVSDSESEAASATLLSPPENAYFTPDALDRWATDTNGSPLPPEAKEELGYLDATEDGCLTFNGFLQIYQLQTENDEEETWRDLFTHGFDRKLALVTTRREDMESDSTSQRQSRLKTTTSRNSTPTSSPEPELDADDLVHNDLTEKIPFGIRS